jgi:hypothetical protein
MRAVSLLCAACVLAAVTAAPALADLPRTYQVQRIDGPNPTQGASFGSGMTEVGDLNGDGVPDFAMGVAAGSPNGDGEVFIYSGKTGSLIDTITAPDPGGAGSHALFGVPYVSSIPDIGSCPGKTTGQMCTNPIGPKDGVPELLIGARGVDVGGVTDVGRAYVYDGATRALMKRIDMPPADRTALAVSSSGAWFGRVVMSPTGLPPCAGNGGIGPCQAMPDAVRIGDLDGGGMPDIVVGASHYTENNTTAYPTSNCALTIPSTCIGAGRAYVYRGEDIAGSDPNVILDTPMWTLRNPAAQADNPLFVDPTANRELFANAIAPVGDVGTCTTAGIQPGDFCPASGVSTTPDGRPDILITNFRADLPLANPDPAWVDVGVDYLVDGATGAILYTYQHPEPQAGAIFGSSAGGPPVGNLGDTALPDVYLSAVTQNGEYKGQGKGYVMDGNVKAFSSTINFSVLNDPNPSPGGNFGGGYTAVGNVVDEPGQARNELLIGQSNLGEPPNPDLIGAVHFFDPLKAQVLQTIADPDQSPGSHFGSDVIALGDVNGDGFLDFAVSAPNYSGAAGPGQGRVYLFRSDNSPVPSPPVTTPVTPPMSMPPAPNPVLAPAALRVGQVFVKGGRLTFVARVRQAATGEIGVHFTAAGVTVAFSQTIVHGVVRVSRKLSGAAARAGAGTLAVSYAGSAQVLGASVSLVAGSRSASLTSGPARIASGVLRVSGTIARSASGVVRLRLGYDAGGGTVAFASYVAHVKAGHWGLDQSLPAAAAKAGGELDIDYAGSLRSQISGAQLTQEVSPS